MYLVFAYKQAKEQILFQVLPLKMLNTFLCVLILGLRAKFSEALRQVNTQHFKEKFCVWGSLRDRRRIKVVELWPWEDGLDPNHNRTWILHFSDQLFNCHNI